MMWFGIAVSTRWMYPPWPQRYSIMSRTSPYGRALTVMMLRLLRDDLTGHWSPFLWWPSHGRSSRVKEESKNSEGQGFLVKSTVWFWVSWLTSLTFSCHICTK